MSYNECNKKCSPNKDKKIDIDNIRKCIIKECKDTYDLQRVPSYCDRILHKFTNIKIKNNKYESYMHPLNNSDHIITKYSCEIQLNNVIIKLIYLTFNQNAQTYDYKTIIKDFSNYDIIIICQQETTRKENLLQDIKINNPEYYSIIEKTGLFFLKYNIRLGIYIKKNIFKIQENLKIEKRMNKCLNWLCTKGYIGISFTLLIDKTNIKFNIFGAHLPIDTKLQDLGYKERLKGLLMIVRECNNLDTDKCVNLIGGDLNFRIDLNNNIEQLNMSMNNIVSYYKNLINDGSFENKINIFKGWSEDPLTFNPTCKINI